MYEVKISVSDAEFGSVVIYPLIARSSPSPGTEMLDSKGGSFPGGRRTADEHSLPREEINDLTSRRW